MKVRIQGFLADTTTETTPGRPTTQSPVEQTTPAGNDETTTIEAITAEAVIEGEAADALGEIEDLDLDALGFSS